MCKRYKVQYRLKKCVPVRFKEVKQLACFIDGVVMHSDSFAKCEYGRILKQLLSCSTAFYYYYYYPVKQTIYFVFATLLLLFC